MLHVDQLTREYKSAILVKFIEISCSCLSGYNDYLYEEIYRAIVYDRIIEDISLVRGDFVISDCNGTYITTSILKNLNVAYGRSKIFEGWMHEGIHKEPDNYSSISEIFYDQQHISYCDMRTRKSIVGKLSFTYIDQILRNPSLGYCMPRGSYL
jgi:hypothetical protein